MKLIKLTMLAATAAVVASAFIGASSASATTPTIALCDAQQLSNCETNHLLKHPLLGNLRLLAGKGKFNAGFVNIECTSGEGETNAIESQQVQIPATTTTLPAEAFKATLEKLTFAGCTGCTGVAVKVPQAMELWMEEPATETWWLSAEGARVKFTGCPLGATCTYEGNLKFKVQMDGEGAFADPEGKEFKLVEGNLGCAKVGKWESGRTRVDWKLDDLKGSVHKNVWPTLLEASEWIALCDAQQLSNCETNHLLKHPLLGNLRLLAGKGKFNAGFVNIECTSGEGETNAIESQQVQIPATTTTLPAEAFKATLEKLTFAGCTGCTGVAVKVPQAMELWMEEPATETWWLSAEGARVKFTGCPLGATCTYEGNLKFKVQMDGEGAFADPEGKEFKLVEGNLGCAKVGKWESGRTRVDWKLDDLKGSVHKNVWPTLLETLTVANGTEL